MPAQTPAWFEPKFKKGAIHRLQSEGYILRGTAMEATTVEGYRVYWRRAGTGEASILQPGMSQSPVMNAGRDSVYVDFVDYEANEFVKKSDLNKMSENEQQIVQQTIGRAMGRQFDRVQLAAMDADTDVELVDLSGAALSIVDPMTVQGKIFGVGAGSYDYYCALPKEGMQQLELYTEFNSSDFVGTDLPLLKQLGARKWRNITFIPMPDGFLNVAVANTADGYMWVKDAIGFEWNQQLSIRTDWLPKEKGWFLAGDYACAAKVVLPEAVKRMRIKTNAALTRPAR